MIVAPTEFRDEECLDPKAVLEGVGVEVIIASKGTRFAKGKLGVEVEVQKDISEIDNITYDAVIFVGGPVAAQYFNDPTVLRIAKESLVAGKVTAAICIAP